jgi:hypothetical protein
VRSRKPKCFFGLKGSRGSRKGGQESAVAASSGRLESVSDLVWLLVERKGKSLHLARNQGSVSEVVWLLLGEKKATRKQRTPFQTGS